MQSSSRPLLVMWRVETIKKLGMALDIEHDGAFVCVENIRTINLQA